MKEKKGWKGIMRFFIKKKRVEGGLKKGNE